MAKSTRTLVTRQPFQHAAGAEGPASAKQLERAVQTDIKGQTEDFLRSLKIEPCPVISPLTNG